LPDQTLSLDDLERFTDALGGRDITPFVKSSRPAYVIRILKEPHEKLNFANAWHTDLSYLEAPPSFTVLYCSRLLRRRRHRLGQPVHGVRDALARPARHAARLNAVHPPAPPTALAAISTASRQDVDEDRASPTLSRVRPPRRHRPCRDRQTSAVCQPVYTQRIAGWTKAESDGLLGHVFRHAVNENFTWRLRWPRARSPSGTIAAPSILRSTTITVTAAKW